MKKAIQFLLTASIIVTLASAPAFGAFVDILAGGSGEASVGLGDTISVDISMNLDPSESALIQDKGIVGFSIGIVWDDLFRLIAVTPHGSLNLSLQDGSFADIPVGQTLIPEWAGVDNENLLLGGTVPSSSGPQTNDFSIATLELRYVGPGDASLQLFPGLEIFGLPNMSWGLYGGEVLEDVIAATGIGYGSVTIHQAFAAVPIPSAFILLAGGLMGMIGVRRRRAV